MGLRHQDQRGYLTAVPTGFAGFLVAYPQGLFGLLKGAGASLEMPGTLSGTITVQLKARGGFCWQALFQEPFEKNDGVKFLAVGE